MLQQSAVVSIKVQPLGFHWCQYQQHHRSGSLSCPSAAFCAQQPAPAYTSSFILCSFLFILQQLLSFIPLEVTSLLLSNLSVESLVIIAKKYPSVK